LGLGELLGAKRVPVRGQRLVGRVVRDMQVPARGLARGYIS
jgi:hypothetical protein